MSTSNKRPAMSIKEQLVPIIKSDNGDFVNARDLHNFIKSKQNFADWIKSRIEKYQFQEGIDYFKILDSEKSKGINHKLMKNSPKNEGINHKLIDNSKNQRGRPEIEYEMSLDMAKELSMIENTEQGRQVRKYFIEVEKAARNNSTGHVVDVINEYEMKIEKLDADRAAITAEIKKLRAAQKDVIKNPYKQIGIIPFPNKKEVANG